MSRPLKHPWKRSALARVAIRCGTHFVGKDGKLWRWARVGEDIGDNEYYWDDLAFHPTTNSGNPVNYPKNYAHPLLFQEPAGCLDWETVLDT